MSGSRPKKTITPSEANHMADELLKGAGICLAFRKAVLVSSGYLYLYYDSIHSYPTIQKIVKEREEKRRQSWIR